MKYRTKAAGAILGVVVLVLAVGASAARSEQFTAASYPATITGSQTEQHKLVIGGNRSVSCSTAKMSASLTGPSKELFGNLTYVGCVVTILGNSFDITRTMEGCTQTLKEPTGKTSLADITCPEGKAAVTHVYSGTGVEHTEANEICRYIMPSQENLAHLTYAKNGNALDVTASISGIAMQRVKGTLAACGATSQTATATGKSDLKAESGGVGVALDVG